MLTRWLRRFHRTAPPGEQRVSSPLGSGKSGSSVELSGPQELASSEAVGHTAQAEGSEVQPARTAPPSTQFTPDSLSASRTKPAGKLLDGSEPVPEPSAQGAPMELLLKDSEDFLRECKAQLERWPHLRWHAHYRARRLEVRLRALVEEPNWPLLWWVACVRAHGTQASSPQLATRSKKLEELGFRHGEGVSCSTRWFQLGLLSFASLLQVVLLALLIRWQLGPFSDAPMRDSTPGVSWCPQRQTAEGTVLNRLLA
eukprot:2496104-Prymnesium_polylepis.1